MDLLTTSTSFYRAIKEKELGDFQIDLTNLFNREQQLINFMVSSIQGGLISNNELNNSINQLTKERIILGNYEALAMSIHPATNVEITDQEIMCSFQQPPINNTNSLRDLGAYLSHLVQSFEKQEPLIINLTSIVTAYNLAVQNSILPSVLIPTNDKKYTISRSAVVTLIEDLSISSLSIPEQNIAIPIMGANLVILTETQLTAILIYIDSLREPEGTSDTRFVHLQNEIVRELARRRL